MLFPLADDPLTIGRTLTALGGIGVAGAVGWMVINRRGLVLARELDKAELRETQWKDRAERNEAIAWKAATMLEQVAPLMERLATELARQSEEIESLARELRALRPAAAPPPPPKPQT